MKKISEPRTCFLFFPNNRCFFFFSNLIQLRIEPMLRWRSCSPFVLKALCINFQLIYNISILLLEIFLVLNEIVRCYAENAKCLFALEKVKPYLIFTNVKPFLKIQNLRLKCLLFVWDLIDNLTFVVKHPWCIYKYIIFVTVMAVYSIQLKQFNGIQFCSFW